MYLKNIKMQGFKSFADKINMEFGSGITAIVGPNGSGKSNISDAIRWVLGEQSIKSLRGSKMEDVIFAGTQKRSPLGFAQVSISFDNSDELFNIEQKELCVTRRVTRSGESDYYINNNPCRLKDIHELFMDTGLGREGYSVIGQGKIDQILSSKAEERRHIFEEASGITKYKYRKNESERKLLQADENLVRIKDILVSLEERVEPLRIQSEKAKKYLDLREQLKGLDINISIRSIDRLRANLEKGKKQFDDTFRQLNDEKLRLDIISEQIFSRTDKLNAVNDEINTLKEQSFALEKENESLRGKIEILRNDIKNNAENIVRWKSDAKVIEEKTQIAITSIENLKSSIGQKEKQKSELEAKLKESDAKIAEAEENISKKMEESQRCKDEIVSLLEEISALRARISGFSALIKNFDERRNALQSDLDEKTAAIEKNNAAKEQILKQMDENSKNKSDATKKMLSLKDEYFKIRGELEKAKEEQNKRVTALNDKTSRMSTLEELEKGLEGYSGGVKSVLNSGITGIHGLVSKLISVDDKYVTAIEIALGNMIQNIIVDDENCAKKCIAHLSSTRGGRATFLPITSVRGEVLQKPPVGEKGYIGIASELVGHESRYDDIFESLLGRTVVVDNIDNAVSIAKKFKYRFKMVTLDGQLINAGGSITGGSFNKNRSLLGRSKQIETLKGEISELKKTVNENDRAIDKLNDKISDIAEEKDRLQEMLSNCEHERVRLDSELGSNKRISDELKRSVDTITNENGDIVKNIAEVKTQSDALKQQIVVNEKEIYDCRAESSELEEQIELLTQQRDKMQEDAMSDRIAFGSADKDIEAAHASMYSAESTVNSLKMELSAKNNDIAGVSGHSDALEKDIAANEEKIQTNIQIMSDIAAKIEQTQQNYENDTQKLKNVQNSLKEQNETIYLLQQETAKLESKNAKYESDTEAVINKLWDDYELTYNTALEYKKADFDVNEGQKNASSLRAKIKGLGNINIDAIEEYKEVKEKFDFLSAQKNDLDETKAKLEEIIRNMQKIMTEQFVKNFEMIRQKFDSVFNELFGGGAGKLTLTEPDNVLESGIEIEVQPPGKKLQNMMALSGGEKALSAIALLFAVLEVRPTPFCILDEVEAALDDNNVYRFADYIRKYSKKTQFIVVTHRRGTMEAADIMYGITMQEKGVSKLLKLKFEDLEDYK